MHLHYGETLISTPTATRLLRRGRRPVPVTFVAVGDVGEHSGYVAPMRGPIWPEGPGQTGWTYQDATGPHGTVLYDGPSEAEARRVLDGFLRCSAAEAGAYCYTHNPIH